MLSIRHLAISFERYTAGFARQNLNPVVDLSVQAACNQVSAIIGASGSGKSLLAHAVLGLLPGNATIKGDIFWRGSPLTPARQKALRGREIALIPQSVSYLNPLIPVGIQVQRAVLLSGLSQEQAISQQRMAFAYYDLPASVETLYPFQLSGGMARRVLIAIAAVSSAQLIIADEPTPGLDDALIGEVMQHLRRLANQGRAVLLITHDILAATSIADSITVFENGQTVETLCTTALKAGHAAHPYTQALWQAVPENGFCLPSTGQEG